MNNLTEREIQTVSVKALRKLGYTVCVTSNGKKTANTAGTPDAFVFRKLPTTGYWLALEFKSTRGKVSIEQEDLRKQGAIYICRSVDDALRAVGMK